MIQGQDTQQNCFWMEVVVVAANPSKPLSDIMKIQVYSSQLL